jgi:ABC-type spermidine/putrescine transport system permease subunit II
MSATGSRPSVSAIALAIYGSLVIAFLLLPVIAVIPMSLNDAPVFEVIPSQPSLAQYRQLFSSPEWLDVLWRSVRIAAMATVVAGVVGTLAAIGTLRLPVRLRAVAEAILIAPQIVPSIVIATAAYYLFASIGLVGATVSLVVMHAVIAMPFVLILVQSRLQGLDPALIQASASLGAGPLRTFWFITLPQLRMALFGAAVLAFHVSFDEVVIALFLSGARTVTLPVKLWNSILFEVTPLLPAISTLVVLAPLTLALPVLLLRGRSARSRAGKRNSEAGS